VLALTHDGLHIPAPAVVDWAEAIDAHITQSEGRSGLAAAAHDGGRQLPFV
jgi:hypothetical protein